MPRKPTGRIRSRKLHAWVKPDLMDEFEGLIEKEGYTRDGGVERALESLIKGAADADKVQ